MEVKDVQVELLVVGRNREPAPWAHKLFLLECKGMWRFGVEDPTEGESKFHQAIRSPIETNWKKEDVRHHCKSLTQLWCNSITARNVYRV